MLAKELEFLIHRDKLFPSKDLEHRLIKHRGIPEVGSSSVVGDGLFFFIRRVVRCGPHGRGLHSQKFAIAQSIVAPLIVGDPSLV